MKKKRCKEGERKNTEGVGKMDGDEELSLKRNNRKRRRKERGKE